MKLSFQKSFEQRLQFIIGFTQLTLMEENRTLWIISQIVSNLQKIAILKLVFHMQSVHTLGVQNENSYTQDLELVFKLTNPTVFIPKVLSNEYIFACQFLLWFCMIIPILYITICMIEEIEYFKQSKFKSKHQLNVQQSENIADSIQIMHQIYNHHNYIENFQHKLMQDRSINTSKMTKLRLISLYINYFPHVLLLPTLYFIFETDLLTQHVESQNFIIMINTLNILISVQLVIVYLISMIFVQLSYTLHDSNYLKLTNSYSEWFHQFFYIIPLIIGYFSILWDGIITLNSTIYIIIKICVLISLTIDYYNDFSNIPYIQNYKYLVTLTMKSIITLIVFLSLTDFNDQQIINQTFILSPLLAKFLLYIRVHQIENILQLTMKKEKIYVLEQIQKDKLNTSSPGQTTESGGLQIEVNNQQYKEFQTSILKHHDLKYFIHFLSLIQQMNLEEIGIYTKNSGIKMNIQKSRILMNCIILLRQHTENCSTIKYCFCRGLKGEKRQIFRKFEIVKEMKIYDDFKIVNIQIYVELIMRYLRDYAKLVFQLEIKKQQPKIMYLQKIIIFLLSSDECYNTQLLLLKLKVVLDKSSSILERQSLELLLSYAKFQILHKMQTKISKLQIEITLKYEDFRLCEMDRDKVLASVFQRFQCKKEGLIQLNESHHTYESLEKLIIQMTNEQLNVEIELQDFQKTALSRTSLYCYMLYCLEGSNNYDLFIKLCNSLNTTETKFFEYPPFYYNTEEQAYRVGFLLLNLSQSPEANQQRGQIVQYSKHLPQFLGYSHSEFQNLSNMGQILYPSLIKPHTEMVEIFVLTNRPNFFRIQFQFFCQQKTKGLVTQIENFIDITFNYRNNILPCYCFLKEVKRDSFKNRKAGYLLLDRFGIIESVTEQVCKNFELENHHCLYLKQIKDIMPVFENIQNNLEDKLMRYFDKNQQEDEDDVQGQTLTTQDKLVQIFSSCYDQITVAIKNNECIMQFQLDVEATLRYSKLNKVEYKIYQLEIKNVFKLGAACSEMSPLTKTLSEYSDSSANQAIKLKEYAFVNMQQKEPEEQIKQQSSSLLLVPQIISNPLTQRTLFNQEQQPLQDIHLQQDYLCSEFQDIQSKQESDRNKQQDDSEEQQQRLYINSLSSTSQGKSEIQRIVSKSHYYAKFAEVKSKPLLIYAILLLNIFSLVAILSFSITNTILYNNWQGNTKNNIQILQAFTMTSYARVTTQGSMLIVQELQKSMDVTQYLPSKYNSDSTELTILQYLTDENINIFLSQMDTFSQNQIIRSVFTSVKLNQIDVIDKMEKSVDGWTALFQLIYMMNCLYTEELYSNQDQYVLALYYMLQSYQQYNEAYILLNTRFTDEIYSLLTKQDSNIDYILYIAIGIFVIYCFLSFMLQYSFYQLLKKYLRCCEQISHSAIENEINHLDQILENYKNFQEFDLYEYHFSLKEKFHNEITEEKVNNYKSATVSSKIKVNQKKFIEIHNQYHLRRTFTFLFYNISFIITIIVIIINRTYDKQLISNLQFDLSLYQQCIKFTESIAESTLTNFALQIAPLFQQVNLFDPKDSDNYYLYTNSSYNQATTILSEILFSDTTVGMQLKELFSSNICLKTSNITLCESISNGTLKDGLLLAQQDILSIIRENIDLYETDGKATVYLQMEDMICQDFMIDAIQSFIDQVRNQIEDQIIVAFNEKIIIWTVFFVFIIIVNLVQIVWIKIYIIKRIKSIRRFVFILPSHALYVEESFLKTLNYLQRIENSVFYI